MATPGLSAPASRPLLKALPDLTNEEWRYLGHGFAKTNKTEQTSICCLSETGILCYLAAYLKTAPDAGPACQLPEAAWGRLASRCLTDRLAHSSVFSTRQAGTSAPSASLHRNPGL